MAEYHASACFSLETARVHCLQGESTSALSGHRSRQLVSVRRTAYLELSRARAGPAGVSAPAARQAPQRIGRGAEEAVAAGSRWSVSLGERKKPGYVPVGAAPQGASRRRVHDR